MNIKKSCNLHIMHLVSGDLWAGAEVQMFTLANTLHNKLGATVSVVILNHGKLEQKLREAGIEVIVLDESRLNGLQIFLHLRNILRDRKPDVLHTHRTKENILGSLTALFNGNTPSLRTQHGAPEHHPPLHQIPKQMIRLLDWFCGQYLQQRIIAVSDDLANLLKRNYSSDRVEVIENGVDVESLTKSVTRTQETKKTLTHTIHIGIAGRLVPVKRVDIYLEAARLLLLGHPELDLTFHIFGDGPLREELEALTHKLNIHQKIVFEGHCDNMANELSDLDVLVMTSDHEGLPMILLEAMALRVPVIAHRVGGIHKLLDGGNYGILVDDHTPSGYAKAIHEMATNMEKRAEVSINAQNLINLFYSSIVNANEYCTRYREISK